MFRARGFILLVFVFAIIFVEPVRNYMGSLFQRDKSKLKEGQIIGAVSGYNPQVKEIQKILEKAGFEPGPIDGLMGRQTRSAIKGFQKKERLKPTGKIDSITWSVLNREDETIKSTSQSIPTADLTLGSSTQIDLKGEDLKIEIVDTTLESKEKIKQIQIALKKAGFYRGRIDGKFGPQTRRAIRSFQKSNGLKVDGIVGPNTLEALGKFLEE